jgi:small nuclear ribonucleoprotein (snRNP)-like protein
VEWIIEMTSNYRKYRTLRTELRKLNQELNVFLDDLEEEVIKKTEKLKNYF